MEILIVIFEVTAMLALIILPLIGPHKKKEALKPVLSCLSVNEKGFLEYQEVDNAAYQGVR